jgi:transposase
MKTASHKVPISSQNDTLEVSDLPRLPKQKDQIIEQQQQAISNKKIAISESEKRIIDRDHAIEDRKHIIYEQQKLRLACKNRFCDSSEKLPFHRDFFEEAELEVALCDIEQQIDEQEKRKPKLRKHRKGFSEKLPRVRIELPLSEQKKARANQTFFAKLREELDNNPDKARIIEYWQEKAVFEENAIRPFAVERRNWLFLNTPCRALASTTIYSLIETAKAKANDIEPYGYLLHVLKHIATADTVAKLESLCTGTRKTLVSN